MIVAIKRTKIYLLHKFKYKNQKKLKRFKKFRFYYFFKYKISKINKIVSIYASFTRTNFYLTAIYYRTNKALVTLSSGMGRFKGVKLKLSYGSIEEIITIFVKKLLLKKIKYIHMVYLNKRKPKRGKFSGIFFKLFRKYRFYKKRKNGFKILSYEYKIRGAHNGIRKRKARRL